MAERKTLAEYLAGQVGLFKGTKVAAFIVAWGIYTEKVDGPHTLEGYSSYWRQSVATTYRERDLFRICFPADKVPDRVWTAVRLDGAVRGARLDARRRDVAAAQAMSVLGSWS